jgi:hypothetical protein
MKYPELCEAVRRRDGEIPLWDPRYPDLGAPYAELAMWMLETDSGGFHVGSLDRGSFNVSASFATEDAACDYIYSHMEEPPPARVPSADEIARTDEITANYLRAYLDGKLDDPPRPAS